MQNLRNRQYSSITIITALISSLLIINIPNIMASANYTFTSENVTKGYSYNSANRNSEDSIYQTLCEADQYADTNFSGSSENVITGTTSGGAFPSALDTDDSTRRNYIEASSSTSPTYQNLRTTSDGTPLTMVPTPAVSHYLNLDETTVGGDGDTSYIEGTTNAQEDTYGMSDTFDPGGVNNIDVIIWHISSDEGATSNLQVGLHIGASYYLGWQGDLNSGVYTNYSYEWVLNPSTSAEWSLSEVNALQTYLKVTDANPDTRTTQLALRIEFTPTPLYTLNAEIIYSSVLSTSQTISYNIICQGYRNGDTENIKVQAWNYITSGWIDKITISAGSDTDYNFDLTTQERDSGTNEIKLKISDYSGDDATQTTVYFDLLKVNRIEKGYALDIDMSTSSVPTYGNLAVKIKGYTTTESFNLDIWNYSSSDYDTAKLVLSDLSNTMNTYQLIEEHHRSGTSCKIRFQDTIGASSDTTPDVYYLDVAWIAHTSSNPTFSDGGCNPIEAGEETTIHFYVIIWDIDNDLPSTDYPKVIIAGDPFIMTENSSGDTSTWDGKAYYYDTSDIIPEYPNTAFRFSTKDDYSSIQYTGYEYVRIHENPTLTIDGVDPATGYSGETFSFFVTYDDILDWDLPSYVRLHIDGSDYNMIKNNTDDFEPPISYYYEKIMSTGIYPYYFKTKDTYSSEITTVEKSLTVTETNQPPYMTDNGCNPFETNEDNIVHFYVIIWDDENDLPSTGYPKLLVNSESLTMTENSSEDTSTIDGKAYYLDKSDIPPDLTPYEFQFVVKDDYSSEIFSGIEYVRIHYSPTLTNDGVDPATGESGETFNFFVIYDDTDLDLPSYVRLHIDGSDYDMNKNDTEDITPPIAYYYGKELTTGIYPYYFKTKDSFSGEIITIEKSITVTAIPEAPYFTSTPIITGKNNTYYSYTVTAHDNNSDELTFDLDTTTNATFLSINPVSGLISGTPTVPGFYIVSINVTDGTFVRWQNYTLTITTTQYSELNTLLIIAIIAIMMLLTISIIYIIK